MLNYTIVPPSNLLDASTGSEPDDLSRTYVKIEVTGTAADFSTVDKIRFKINQQASGEILLTTNPRAIVPIVEQLNDWDFKANGDPQVFEATRRPRSSAPIKAVFKLQDVEVIEGSGITNIHVEEVDISGATTTSSLPIRISVPELRINFFNVVDAYITSEQSTELSWDTAGESPVVSLTALNADGAEEVLSTEADGSLAVSPDTTTTYTLRVQGDGKTLTRQLTITVLDQSVVANLVAKSILVSDPARGEMKCELDSFKQSFDFFTRRAEFGNVGGEIEEVWVGQKNTIEINSSGLGSIVAKAATSRGSVRPSSTALPQNDIISQHETSLAPDHIETTGPVKAASLELTDDQGTDRAVLSPNHIETTGLVKAANLELTDVRQVIALGGGLANVLVLNADGSVSSVTPSSSSLRYKKNVEPLDDAFEKILLVEPKKYDWKESGKPSFGYIAEELDGVGLNRLVRYDDEGRPDGVHYEKISLYLAEVVKQQQVELNRLSARVDALASLIDDKVGVA